MASDFDAYLLAKSLPDCHGNHLEIQAMSEMYNRRIEVYSYGPGPMRAGLQDAAQWEERAGGGRFPAPGCDLALPPSPQSR